MTTFAIIAPSGRDDLTAAVAVAFPTDHLEFAPGQFVIVSNELTAQGVTTAIGASGQVGQVVVFAVASWWGYHSKLLWDWLSARGATA